MLLKREENLFHNSTNGDPQVMLREDIVSRSVVEQQRSPSRIRIVHLVTRLGVAGMENVVVNLLRGISSDRYDSALWCIEEADLQGRELLAEGEEVLELGRRRSRDLTLFFRLAALLRRSRIEIVHCHDEVSWFYGAIAAWLSRTSRVFVTMHGRRLDISRRHLFEQRLLGHLTSAIVSVSAYLRKQLLDELNVPPEKLFVIHNGIPLSPFSTATSILRRQSLKTLDLPEESFVLGSVGRLATVKNLGLLLEAAADARSEAPSLRIVLVGDGPCRDRLTRKAAALNLADITVFAGLRRDVDRLLPGLDLYICSSDYEGISLSILEAMAAERAVIATAVGGNREIIRHNETGILVERGDRKALSQAIVKLAHDTDIRHRLGRQARVVVEEDYSLACMLRNYELLYRTI